MRLVSRMAALIAVGFLATTADAAHLVRDINAAPIATGATAAGWVQVGSATLFWMDDGIHGQELWRTDGTPAGTRLVKDINPGPASSNATSATLLGGVLYFIATDGTNGTELWRSDGTSAGTHIVADINPGAGDGATSNSGYGGPLPTLNGVMYFAGTEPGTGMELWRSDGTATGTYRVVDTWPGGGSSAPTLITVVGSRVFFVAGESANSTPLWSTDGTAAGTKRVTSFGAGGFPSFGNLTATTAGLFFSVDDGTHGRELYFANADGSGAHLVTDLSPGSNPTSFSPFVALGGDVLFGASVVGGAQPGSHVYRASSSGVQLLANVASMGAAPIPEGFVAVGNRFVFGVEGGYNSTFEVWVSDGTSGGTRRLGAAAGLLSVSLIGGGISLSALVGSDGLYFWGVTSGQSGTMQLWRTDGTDAGTRVYAAPPQPQDNSDLAQFQGRIWFRSGRFGTSGWEPWVSDGTVAGTQQFADLNPGAADSAPSGDTVVGGRLYFNASSPSGFGPWVSDGTVAGTVPLDPPLAPARSAASNPQFSYQVGNRAVFTADDGVHGQELWASDGTSAGTVLLRDVNPGAGQAPGVIASLGPLLLFVEDDGIHGSELWATDGTPAGTTLVKDINPGAASSSPSAFFGSSVVVNGAAYFTADDGVHGIELWKSDGTAAGTTMVVDLTPGAAASGIASAQPVGNRVVFRLVEPAGWFLWSTDGTAAGTQRASAAVQPTSIDSVVVNGLLYFGGQPAPVTTASHGQLWRTDGTPAGTTLVADPAPSASYSGVDYFSSVGGHVLFDYCSNGATATCGEYTSDGTAAGTVPMSPDIVPGNYFGIAGASAVVGNQIYYGFYTSTTYGLRVSDGTAAGTRDIYAAPVASGDNVLAFAVVQGHVVFTRRAQGIGPSVWTTDGTAAGTRLVADVDPGTAQWEPGNYLAVGNQMLFTAYTPQTGVELYALDITRPDASDDAVVTAGSAGTGTPIAVLANDGGIVAPLAPGSVQVTVAPTQGTTSVDPSTGVITYTANAGAGGNDQFSYTVADTRGVTAAPATVYVSIAEPAGPAPGTAPPAPTPTPAPAGQSGGGAFDPATLAALALLAGWVLLRRRRASGEVMG